MDSIRLQAASISGGSNTALTWVDLPDATSITLSVSDSQPGTVQASLAGGSWAEQALPDGPVLLGVRVESLTWDQAAHAPYYVVTERETDQITGDVKLTGKDVTWVLAGGLTRPGTSDDEKRTNTRAFRGKTAYDIMSTLLSEAQSNGECLNVKVSADSGLKTLTSFEVAGWTTLDQVLAQLVSQGTSYFIDGLTVRLRPQRTKTVTATTPVVWAGRELSDGQVSRQVSSDPSKVIAESSKTHDTATATTTSPLAGYFGQRAQQKSQVDSDATAAPLSKIASDAISGSRPERLSTTITVVHGQSGDGTESSQVEPLTTTLPGDTIQVVGWDGATTSSLVQTISVQQDETSCRTTWTLGDSLYDKLADNYSRLSKIKRDPQGPGYGSLTPLRALRMPTTSSTTTPTTPTVTPPGPWPVVLATGKMHSASAREVVQARTDSSDAPCQPGYCLGHMDVNIAKSHSYLIQVSGITATWTWTPDNRERYDDEHTERRVDAGLVLSIDTKPLTGVAVSEDSIQSAADIFHAYWADLRSQPGVLTKESHATTSLSPSVIVNPDVTASMRIYVTASSDVLDTRLTWAWDSDPTDTIQVIDLGPATDREAQN